jgi:hypothetical protein
MLPPRFINGEIELDRLDEFCYSGCGVAEKGNIGMFAARIRFAI